MNFYDLHIHSAFSEGKSSLEQLASMAKQLGYSGICFSAYYKGDQQLKKLQVDVDKIRQKFEIEILLGFEACSLKELAVLRDKRKRFDILLVRGGDARLNREAVETTEVDILTHPEHERIDSGLNHILMKLAAKNNVAVEINFREILVSSKRLRSITLKHMTQNIELARKFKAPIIICSGAVSHFEMRDPSCLASMGCQLGLSLKEAKDTVSKNPEKIIKQLKERKGANWIAPGIKVIK